ncbi:hypothetical protein [Streptomyces sp. NPDC056160]|uniref:hypothetical protein n=1 Tax=Streptomyces sp. NPDC056160 TaxID=3345731 RepID=UPI0035E31D99
MTKLPIPARLFVLQRDRDVTGVSGQGPVADGVQWPDGTVALRWRERPSTAVWDSLDLMLSVHGHDGATRVVWSDDEAARARAAAGRAYQLADRWEAAHGSAYCLVRAAGAELRDELDGEQDTCGRPDHRVVRAAVDSNEQPISTCDEHDGPCFPEAGARCSAHAAERCALCHRNPNSCTSYLGGCGTWSDTGMHWDTCPNRVSGLLVTKKEA